MMAGKTYECSLKSQAVWTSFEQSFDPQKFFTVVFKVDARVLNRKHLDHHQSSRMLCSGNFEEAGGAQAATGHSGRSFLIY